MFISANGMPTTAPRNAEEMMGDPMGTLQSKRTIFMGGEVEDLMADALVSQLLLLDNQDPGKDIKMYINSPGLWWPGWDGRMAGLRRRFAWTAWG